MKHGLTVRIRLSEPDLPRDPGLDFPAGSLRLALQRRAERDPHPKKTLNELTEASEAVDSVYGEGNTAMAIAFAELWRDHARLGDIEAQCPQGFRPFCRHAANALRRAKARSGRLF